MVVSWQLTGQSMSDAIFQLLCWSPSLCLHLQPHPRPLPSLATFLSFLSFLRLGMLFPFAFFLLWLYTVLSSTCSRECSVIPPLGSYCLVGSSTTLISCCTCLSPPGDCELLDGRHHPFHSCIPVPCVVPGIYKQ